MASKLKCPFCSANMERRNGLNNRVGVWRCMNCDVPSNACVASGYLLNDDMINHIERTKEQLKIAKATLEDITLENTIASPKALEAYDRIMAKRALKQIQELDNESIRSNVDD